MSFVVLVHSFGRLISNHLLMCMKQFKGEKMRNVYFFFYLGFFFFLPLPPSPSLILAEALWLSLIGYCPVHISMIGFAVLRLFCSWRDWEVFNTYIGGCKLTRFQMTDSLNHWWLIAVLERKNEFYLNPVRASQSVFITHRTLVSCRVIKEKLDIISFKLVYDSTVLNKLKKAL